MVLAYIRIKGYGGIVAAGREFGVSIRSIYRWLEQVEAEMTLGRVGQGPAKRVGPLLDT
jgi:hypothetical protein